MTRLHLYGSGFLSAIFILAGSACSSSGGSSATTTPATTVANAAAGVGSAQTNIQKYTPSTADSSPTAFYIHQMLHDFIGALLPSAMATSYTAFGAQWTAAAGMVDLYCGGGGGCTTESIKNYMGQMIDPGFLNSNGSAVGAAGRYVNALFQTCTLMHFMTAQCTQDTDGLPVVGNCTVTVDVSQIPTSGTFGGCPVPPNTQASTGTISITATIAAVSGNPNYTKKITMAGAPVGSGTGTSTSYVKLVPSTGVFNIESISPGDNNTGLAACGGSRFILSTNGTVTSFEYASLTLGTDKGASCTAGGNSSHEDFYRIHIDTAKDVSYILGMKYNASTANAGMNFILSGQPSKLAASSGTISASIWANTATAIPAGASTFNAASADACVTQSSGAISSDGALSCDVAGLDIASTTSMLNSVIATDIAATPGLTNVATPAAIPWTSATDFTTAVTSP